MPNKYSHAFVLAHYESRGWISLRHQYKSKPADEKPCNSEVKRFQPPSTAVPSSSPSAPLPPLPPLAPLSLTTVDGDSVPSVHRATPSIITEIYAPEEDWAGPLKSITLQSRLEPQTPPKTSPTTTKGNSLTSEVSSRWEETPRTSLSSIRALSTGKEDESNRNQMNGFHISQTSVKRGQLTLVHRPLRSLGAEPARSSGNDDSPTIMPSSGIVETPKSATSKLTKVVDETDDSSSFQIPATAAPTLRVVGSPLKPFQKALEPLSRSSPDKYSTSRRENCRSTLRILPLLSLRTPPGSRGSTSSADEAAPPPIVRHRHLLASAGKNADGVNRIRKKPPKDNDPRARPTPHVIRDLTPEVTPWECVSMEESALQILPRSGKARRIVISPDALPWESIVLPTMNTEAAAAGPIPPESSPCAKKMTSNKISRIKGSHSPEEDAAKKDQGENERKKAPRDEREMKMEAPRGSRVISYLGMDDPDDSFFKEFENEGYFWR